MTTNTFRSFFFLSLPFITYMTTLIVDMRLLSLPKDCSDNLLFSVFNTDVWTSFLYLAERFVIVSYNILGVENALKHLDLYDSIPSECLSWDLRKRRMHKELRSYNPSILCFQVSINTLLYLFAWSNVYLHKIHILMHKHILVFCVQTLMYRYCLSLCGCR